MNSIQDIAEQVAGIARDNKSLLAHMARACAIILAIALLLEVFLFNFQAWRTAGFEQIDMTDQLELPASDDGEGYCFTQDNTTIEFHNLNKPLEDIYLEFDLEQPAQNVNVDIQFTDDAHATYFGSTDYTAGVPTATVATNNEESQYLFMTATGNVDDLRIEISGSNLHYPIVLDSVSINAPKPFMFNFTRFLVAFGIMLLVYLFRPKSAIYSIDIRKQPRRSKCFIILATAVQIVLLSAYLFMGTNQVGVATAAYNSGSWDGSAPITVHEVGGDNAQQYAELAKSMTEGHLYLDEEPPAWLDEMDNPYDRGARAEMEKITGETYLWDVAYYEGHYYVYFGVVPVLLFYLPFYVLAGANFPTAIGVLIMMILFVLGCTALLDRFARYHFKRVSLGLFLLLQMPLVFCSGIPYLLKFPTFYSLPIMCALAFAVWGLYFWMRGRTSERAYGWYIAGSLCMALIAGCRPQLLVFSLLAFPLFWRKFITERRILTPRGAREFICLIAPYFVVAAGIMWYNAARFGSPLNFGANYNLTVNDMTMRGFEPGRLLPALFAYFLQTPTTAGVFPWVFPTTFETTYMGQTIKEVTFGGILVCLPVLWILLFARRILHYRMRKRATRTVAGVIVVMLASAVVVSLLDAEVAGILQRYYADFSFLFLASAVLLAFIANEALVDADRKGGADGASAAATALQVSGTRALGVRSGWHTLFMSVLLVLVAVSILYSVLVMFTPETGWISDAYPWAYQGIVEMIQFWC